MNHPIPPKELLRRVADRIEARPHTYDQTKWSNECGTAFCIAGHALVELGYAVRGDGVATKGSYIEPVTTCAGAALGLGYEESGLLFHSFWKPRADLTVPEALRLIADGAKVREVSFGAPVPEPELVGV